LAAALLLVAFGWDAPARAQAPAARDVEEARRHYARGLELYEQGADAAALAELDRAYQLAPNWKVLYEMGIVELQIHDFAGSLRAFERYLDEGADAVPAPRKQEVEARIATLRQQVATVNVTAPPGAEVLVDDLPVGTAPLPKPLVLNPGHHKVGARRGDLTSEARMLSVTGGDQAAVELRITEPPPTPHEAVPEATAPTVSPPETPPAQALPPPPVQSIEAPSPPPGPPYPLWIGWSVTGALAVGAVATGIAALTANSQLSVAKNDEPSSSSSLSGLSSRARGFAVASDVMTGMTVLTGGVTLYFTVRELRRPKGELHPAGPTAGVRLGPGRVSLEATF
jgi:hypothetical protein